MTDTDCTAPWKRSDHLATSGDVAVTGSSSAIAEKWIRAVERQQLCVMGVLIGAVERADNGGKRGNGLSPIIVLPIGVSKLTTEGCHHV
jgi:hypothetical protein